MSEANEMSGTGPLEKFVMANCPACGKEFGDKNFWDGTAHGAYGIDIENCEAPCYICECGRKTYIEELEWDARVQKGEKAIEQLKELEEDKSCAQCGKRIHTEDDDAYVCIQCGGWNRRVKQKTLLDRRLYWRVIGGIVGATIVQLIVKAL